MNRLSAMPQFVYRASPERSIAQEASSGMPMSGWLRYRAPPKHNLQSVAELEGDTAMAEGDEQTLAAAKEGYDRNSTSPSLDPDYRSPKGDFTYPRQTPYRRYRAPPSRRTPSHTDMAEDTAHPLTSSRSAGDIFTSPIPVPQIPEEAVEDEEEQQEEAAASCAATGEHYFI